MNMLFTNPTSGQLKFYNGANKSQVLMKSTQIN